MMDKRSALVISLLSLLLLFSFRGYADPMCSNPTNTTPPTYDPNSPSSFSVTCTNASTVFITIYNSTNGVLVPNDSMTGTNNYAYSIILPAGTWKWIYYANDTSNNWNSTNNISISINKGTLPFHLFLDSTDGDRTNLTGYKLNNMANFSIFLNTSNIPYTLGGYTTYLNSNFTPWNVQNSSNSTLNYQLSLNKTGLFSLTANWTGNVNYSASNQTHLFTITDLGWSANSTSILSGSQYVSGNNYGFQISWTGNVSKVLFYWNGNNSYYVNNTGNTYWVNLTDLPAGNYNYSWYANDTNNFWNSSDIWNYNVAQIPTILSMMVSSTSVASGSTITFSCYVTNNNPIPSPGLSLALNPGTCPGINNFTSCPVVVPSVVNTETDSYYCSTPGNTNYTSASILQYVVVTGTSTTTITPSPSSSGSPTPTGTFTIKDLASSIKILQGESKLTQFTLSNTLNNNLANVSITVSGIDSSWYTISKNFISNFVHGSTQLIKITFNIPNSAEVKDYNVAITAAGKDILTRLLKTYTATMTLTVNSSQPVPPIPSVTETPQPQLATVQDNNTANITSNQTSVVTGLAPAFEFFKNNLVIILAIAACLLIFIFRDNLTTALGGTLGKEEPEKTHKAKSVSPLKGIKDKLNYKLVVNLKKESKAKNLKEPTKEFQGAEKTPEIVPEKEPKRPAVLEKEIKRDIKELQSIIENEKKVGKNKKKFDMNNN